MIATTKITTTHAYLARRGRGYVWHQLIQRSVWTEDGDLRTQWSAVLHGGGEWTADLPRDFAAAERAHEAAVRDFGPPTVAPGDNEYQREDVYDGLYRAAKQFAARLNAGGQQE